MRKLRKMKLYEYCFIAIFMVVLLFAILSSVVLKMSDISMGLLLLDLPIAVIVAIFASLSIREEEEEKTMPLP